MMNVHAMVSAPRRRRRLVIADDSPVMRQFVRDAIGARFDDVIEVGDGRQLFWQLLRESYTSGDPGAPELVLIIDFKMPAYDGLEVLDAWREMDRTVATIMITAFPSADITARARELGASLLAKPFSVAELRTVVDGALDRRCDSTRTP